jgi:glutaredoxin 3
MTTSGSQKHSPDVIIYTTPHCHWCGMAKHYFAENNIAYREVDVSVNGPERREMTLMTGGTAVPVIKVGAFAMSGWDEAEFTKLLTGAFKQR